MNYNSYLENKDFYNTVVEMITNKGKEDNLSPKEKVEKQIKNKEFALKLNSLKLDHYSDDPFKKKKFTQRVMKNRKELQDLKTKLMKTK